MGNDYVNFSGSNPFGSQAKLILHIDRLYEYMSKDDTRPIFMEIGLTNKCNMNCVWCITENGRDNKEGDSIDIDVLERYFREFYEFGGKAVTFCGQGEPTYYKHFERATKSAISAGLELGLMSNGIFPKKLIPVIGDNFKWVRFSVDTLDKEKYRGWKGINGAPTVKRNVELLRGYPVNVGVNCNVATTLTVDDAKSLIDWADREEGISYLQFRPILPRYYKNENPELNDKVWEYLESQSNNPKINLSNDKLDDIVSGNLFKFRSCEGHFFEPILDASGNVKICTYHPGNNDFTFGNIYEKSFREIWESDQRKTAIEFVRNLNYSKRCQACCKCTEINKLIDFMKHPEESKDINFL